MAQKHMDLVDPDSEHCFLYKYLLYPVRTAAASSSPEAEPAVKKTRRQISRAIFGDSSQDEEEEMEQTDSVQILDTEPLQKVTSSVADP